MRKKNSGMTLMELLVVIAILGLLAGIAIPTYRNYVIRANRADAKTALLAMAGALERCFTQFNSYAADDGCTAVTADVPSTEGKYTVTATTQTATEFVLTATAVAGQGQDRDTDCGALSLNSANVRGASGAGDDVAEIRRCWGK